MTLDSNHWFNQVRHVMTNHRSPPKTCHLEQVGPQVHAIWPSWYGPTVVGNNYFYTKQKTHIHKFDGPNRFFYPSSFDLKIFARAGPTSIAKIGYPQKQGVTKISSLEILKSLKNIAIDDL